MYELGIPKLDELKCLLPNYKYDTPPYGGIIENEFCPVFVAYTDCEPHPNPDEVASFQWTKWPEYVQMLSDHPDDMSYWAKDQYQQLAALEPFAGMMHRDTHEPNDQP